MQEIKPGTIVRAWNDGEGAMFGKYRMYFPSTKIHDIIIKEAVDGAIVETMVCDYAEPINLIEQFLPEGVKIGDKVMFSDKESYYDGELVAVTTEGKFVDDEGDFWDNCRPMKKTKIVKPLKELILTLIDEGYRPDSFGNWDCEGRGTLFLVEMMAHCGKRPSKGLTYKESWLTTKEN